MKLRASYPMGPFECADFSSFDICLAILDVLHSDMDEKYRLPVTVKNGGRGKAGEKRGEGYYEY